jgi:hypothetical protein
MKADISCWKCGKLLGHYEGEEFFIYPWSWIVQKPFFVCKECYAKLPKKEEV